MRRLLACRSLSALRPLEREYSSAWQRKEPKEWIEDAEERARLDTEREKGRQRSSIELVRGEFGGECRVYAEEVEPVAQQWLVV